MSGSSPKSISISGVETDITIGKELAAVAQKSKALASRDCFEQLEMYLHGRSQRLRKDDHAPPGHWQNGKGGLKPYRLYQSPQDRPYGDDEPGSQEVV